MRVVRHHVKKSILFSIIVLKISDGPKGIKTPIIKRIMRRLIAL